VVGINQPFCPIRDNSAAPNDLATVETFSQQFAAAVPALIRAL
jgi:hypothetical protein